MMIPVIASATPALILLACPIVTLAAKALPLSCRSPSCLSAALWSRAARRAHKQPLAHTHFSGT